MAQGQGQAHDRSRDNDRLLDGVAGAHSVYFVLFSIWPLIDIRSFEKLTGRKIDRWLVKTVAGLLTIIGAVIGRAGIRKRVTPEIVGLGIGSSAVLATIDVTYVAQGRIRPIYLLDALANTALIGGWVLVLMRRVAR